jgi:hypothetical protein
MVWFWKFSHQSRKVCHFFFTIAISQPDTPNYMPQTRHSKKTPATPPCPAIIDEQMDGQLPSDDVEDPKVNKWGCDFTDVV